MIFLSTLIAIAWLSLVRPDATGEPWLGAWHRVLARSLQGIPLFIAAVLLPVAMLLILIWWLAVYVSAVAVIVVYVSTLMLCFGPGDFARWINGYLEAGQREDNIAAREWIDLAQQRAGFTRREGEAGGWIMLHRQALDVIGYTAMHRYFAVLFWFFVMGPAGALFYRLTDIHHRSVREGRSNSRKFSTLLQVFEWPVSRLLGLGWALVGQFDTCMAVLKRDSLRNVPLPVFLGNCMQGAAGIAFPLNAAKMNDSPENPVMAAPPENTGPLADEDTTPAQLLLVEQPLQASLWKTIENSRDLLSRTLLLWVCVSALITLSL